MAGNIIELTDDQFESTISGDKPVLVDFWAPWCGPCRMLGPVIEQIASEYQGKAIVCKMNIDDQRQVALQFGVTNIPTIILCKKGQMEKKWVGLTPKGTLTAAIDELLS